MITFSTLMSNKVEAQIFSYDYLNYVGPGTIYYPGYGVYYGEIYNGAAHGNGTFYYYADGSFYYGNYYNGLCDGPGVFVSSYGYLSGCFAGGYYMGECIDVYDPYQNSAKVQDVIEEVSYEISEVDEVEIDPDGYEVIQIDPNTEIGTQMFGGVE